jgi:hypothetical protein
LQEQRFYLPNVPPSVLLPALALPQKRRQQQSIRSFSFLVSLLFCLAVVIAIYSAISLANVRSGQTLLVAKVPPWPPMGYAHGSHLKTSGCVALCNMLIARGSCRK